LANADQTEPEAAAAEVDPSRLRVQLKHLLVFMAVYSALFSANVNVQNFETPAFNNFPIQQFQTYMQLFAAVIQAVSAAGITATIFGFLGRRKGKPFLNEPGHWMLVELSLIALLSLPMVIGLRFMSLSGQAVPAESAMILAIGTLFYSFVVLIGGKLAINVYVAIKRFSSGPWQWFFIVKAVGAILSLLAEPVLLWMLYRGTSFDRRENIARDSFHWCGCYVQIAQSCMMLIMFLGQMVLFAVMFSRGFR